MRHLRVVSESSADVGRTTAIRFVVLLGVVSLFADMTYEGARSVTGPFLAVLGASGTAVGLIAGLGELIGYSLRLASGYLADRTGRYWAITLVGYGLNLIAVPLLALAGRWEIAAALMICERVGKAIRTPARDAMLSHATHQVGHGWGFGLHEAMDQAGAVRRALDRRGGPGDRRRIPNGIRRAARARDRHAGYSPAGPMALSEPPRPRAGDADPPWPWIPSRLLALPGRRRPGRGRLCRLSAHRLPLRQDLRRARRAGSPSSTPIAMGVDALAALAFGRLLRPVRAWSTLIVAVLCSAFFAPAGVSGRVLPSAWRAWPFGASAWELRSRSFGPRLRG